MIPDGYTELPGGKIVSVVTYLVMSAPPAAPPVSRSANWFLRQHPKPDLQWYRTLFRAVGQEWLWFSRLQLDDDA